MKTMSGQEIIEGNILIAIFMGMKRQDEFTLIHPEPFYQPIDRGKLVYHSSWNSLMPVVEKIENTGKRFCVMIGCGTSEILDVEHEYSEKYALQAVFHSKIENTWLAVVDFIKWYNSNKS